MFLACDTQWRYAGSYPVGLDYCGVEAAGRMAGIEITPDTLRRLKVIEAAVVRRHASGMTVSQIARRAGGWR